METQQTTEQNVDPNVVDATLEAMTTEETTGEDAPATETPEGEESAPAYEPKLKFKVRDEEHDMEEWVKDYIKDEDTEKKFVDLFTAQKGIELAKQEREEFKGKFQDLEQAVVHVSKLAQEGKIGRFIEELGLSKQAFIDYAINEIQYAQLPEEDRRKIDAQRQQQFQAEQQSTQLTQMEQAYQQQQVENRKLELNYTLMKPEYSQAEQAYDTSVGTPGAFRTLVAQCGNYHWNQYGKDIGTEQAVQEAIRLGRVNVEAAPTQTGNVGTQERPVQQAEKPVIPNFKAGGASPAKKAFTSVDEIRKYANQR